MSEVQGQRHPFNHERNSKKYLQIFVEGYKKFPIYMAMVYAGYDRGQAKKK